jgi:hypothetical protein
MDSLFFDGSGRLMPGHFFFWKNSHVNGTATVVIEFGLWS